MQDPKNFRRILMTAFMLASSALAHGQNSWSFPDFSATQVFESLKAPVAMKVYLSGSSVRVERSAALSTLYVTSQSKVYNLTTYPDQSHQCVVMRPEQARMLPSPLELIQGSDLKRIPAGTEVVEGHPCKVENVVVTRPDGTTIDSKVWEAQDLKGVPIKIESHMGDVSLAAVFRDISVAPQEQVFTIPEKCTPFEKMGQVAEQKTIK